MKQKKIISTYQRIFKEAENTNSDYLTKLLRIADQIKIFHLQTFGYAQHTALGTFYDKVSAFTDSFCEKRIGVEERPKIGKVNIELVDYNESELLNYVNSTLNYFKSLRKEVSGNTDLENLTDEIIGETNQLKYLLTLK